MSAGGIAWSFSRDDLENMSAVELIERMNIDELVKIADNGKCAIADLKKSVDDYDDAYTMCDNFTFLRMMYRQIRARREAGIKVDSTESQRTLKTLTGKLHLIGTGIMGKTPYRRAVITFENNPEHEYDVTFSFDLDGGYKRLMRVAN